jgi:hypothetical protein
MRNTLVLSLLCLAGAASLPAQVPVMHRVLPENGQIGSVLKIQGIYLGKTHVDEVYLTDHTFDMKVKVLDQTEDSIEFRVPPFVKPGRLQLLVKTAGKEPFLLEQPVYINIDEPKEKETPLVANDAVPAAPAPSAQPAPAADGTK